VRDDDLRQTAVRHSVGTTRLRDSAVAEVLSASAAGGN
jgi:hypothetical protein